MAQVQLSTLAEGTLVRVKLASGSYEQYVVAKHNYESGLNGNGLTLLVETSGRIESCAYSTTTQSFDVEWGNGSWCKLYNTINSTSFISRFPAAFRALVQSTKVYYNNSSGSKAETVSNRYFIPSATELGCGSKAAQPYGYTGSAFSATVLNKITRNNVWTRSIANEYDYSESDDGSTVYYDYTYIVWYNTSGTASYQYHYKTAYYNLAFCLPASALVDTDSSNEITGELYFEDDGEDAAGVPMLGIGGVARQVPKLFWGIDNIARKVCKAWLGDANGKAQLVFEGLAETIGYAPTVVASMEWSKYGAGITGKYAIFGGGTLSGSYTSNVIGVEKGTMTTVSASALTSSRSRVVGTTGGDLAYLASGGDGSSRYKTAFYYNADLTMGAFDLSSNHVHGAGARAGDYGLIAGGEKGAILASRTCTNSVEAVTGSATKVTASGLPAAVSGSGSGEMGDKAVIVGGYDGEVGSGSTGTRTVTLYDKDLTQSSFPETDIGRCKCGVAGSKRILVIAGGGTNGAKTYELYSSEGVKLGSTYSMTYGGWLQGGFVNVKTEAYPYGMICFANMSCILGFDGKDGTLVMQSVTGLNSTASTYYHMAAANFGDEVLVPLLYNGNVIAQFKATE